jgi:hypothetical protein
VGTVTDGQFFTSSYLGDRATFNSLTNPASLQGAYTFVIPGGTNTVTGPAGDGYGTVTVANNGIIRAAGKLADGTTFSQSVSVSKYSEWPFYTLFLSGEGSASGWLKYTNLLTTSLDGDAYWFKPVNASAFYPNGFTNVSTVLGSTYTVPALGARVLDITNGVLIIQGGNVLNGGATNAAVMNADSSVTVNLSTVLRLSSSPSGYMSGTFLHPTLGTTKSFYGVALQLQNVARGYFLGSSQSGSFYLY